MTKPYRIASPVDWDGVRHEIGDTVEMPDAIARPLVEVGAIVAADIPAKPPASTEQDPDRRSGRVASGISGEPDAIVPTALSPADDPPPDPESGGGDAGAGDQKPEVDRHAAIVAAASKLDASDPSCWSGRGKARKPKVAALEAVLEYDITAGERDAAWAELQAGRGAS